MDKEDLVHDVKKRVNRLTRMEKRKMHGGDDIIRYEKMGLIEKQDIEKYRKKLGLPKDFDVDKISLSDLESSP